MPALFTSNALNIVEWRYHANDLHADRDVVSLLHMRSSPTSDGIHVFLLGDHSGTNPCHSRTRLGSVGDVHVHPHNDSTDC